MKHNKRMSRSETATYLVFEEIKDVLDDFDYKDVAEEAGVSITTIRNWVSGRTHAPRIDTLTKVAEAMNYQIMLIAAREYTSWRKEAA